jgi:hypothetical protein
MLSLCQCDVRDRGWMACKRRGHRTIVQSTFRYLALIDQPKVCLNVVDSAAAKSASLTYSDPQNSPVGADSGNDLKQQAIASISTTAGP